MKNVLSFIGGIFVTVIVVICAFSTNKVAFVSYEEYSGNAPAYLYSGKIDAKCAMTTYVTMNSIHRSIVAYSAYAANRVAGGATITSIGNRRPEVTFWTDDGSSMNNQFHQVLPALKKAVSKSNTSTVACLGEAKVDKSSW